jgi:hypothetical protein
MKQPVARRHPTAACHGPLSIKCCVKNNNPLEPQADSKESDFQGLTAAMKKKQNEQYSKRESKRRLEAALRGSRQVGPKPMKPKSGGKGK